MVQSFLQRVKEKALGEVVKLETRGKSKRVRPGDHFTYICLKELEALMGPAETDLDLPKNQGSIMMVGLQGSGKTTTCAKLANKYKKAGRKPLLVAADIYRPAAVEQLKTVGQQVGVLSFTSRERAPSSSVAKGLSLPVVRARSGHLRYRRSSRYRRRIDGIRRALRRLASPTISFSSSTP